MSSGVSNRFVNIPSSFRPETMAALPAAHECAADHHGVHHE
jgi:hypothetical protein